MKIDRGIDPMASGRRDVNHHRAHHLQRIFEQTESEGYDGIWTSETNHDPFLPHAVGAAVTSRLSLGTSVAIAPPRSPMQLANVGHDLQLLSEGRFLLGLGPQVRQHIERRFSASWGNPVERMRDMVAALRAIWHSWQTGEPLRYEGSSYRHTVMAPAFDPGPSPWGPPPILLAGVGPRMTALAGEVADGIILHPFITRRYMDEVTIPAFEVGVATSGRSRAGMTVVLPVFALADDAPPSMLDDVRNQLGFYASTPAYAPVLALHGWDEVHDRALALTRAGRWNDLGSVISDKLLDEFCVRAPSDRIPSALRSRYEGVVDRVSINRSYADTGP